MKQIALRAGCGQMQCIFNHGQSDRTGQVPSSCYAGGNSAWNSRTSGAFVQPEWYREFVFPNYKKYFAPLKEAEKKIIYTSDGNFSEFIDDIADCGVNGFVMEPCTDMNYIAEKYGKTHSFIGNADTRILLNGTKEDIYQEVKRCMDIGKKCPGFIMAVGNHIPPNTPVENCLYYNDAYEKWRKR